MYHVGAAKQTWRVNGLGCQNNNNDGDGQIVLLIFVRCDGEGKKSRRSRSLYYYELMGDFSGLDGAQVIFKSLVGIILDHGVVGAKRCYLVRLGA